MKSKKPGPHGKPAHDPYSEIFDSAPVAYLSLDSKGKVLQANLAAASLLEIPRATLVGGRFQAYLAPGGRPEFTELLDRSFTVSGNGIGDLPVLTAAGITRWVHVVLSPAVKGCCRVFATDMTESRRMEERLRSSEAYLKEAQSLGHTGSFRFDFEKEAVALSEEACRLLEIGFPIGAISLQQIRSLIPHGEWDLLSAAAFGAAEARKNMDTIATITRPDGSSRVFHLIAAIKTSPKGRPLEIVGTVRDITEEKRAREALRESEARFRTLIENAPVAIGISRLGTTVYVNRAFLRMLGFEDAGELIGRPLTDQIVPRLREEVMALALRRSRGLPAETEYESVGLRKDGTEFPFRAAVAVVDLADGPATAAFITDITARKEFERKLGDSHVKIRNLAAHLLSAREEERKSAAREIHDELGQLLTALKMDLRWIEKHLGSSGHGAAEKIQGTLGLVDQAIDTVHRISSNLRPGMLDDLGLSTAIEWLGAEFSKRTGISCDAKIAIPESRIGGNGATALFRIVQEALCNVGRHSGASHASILVRESGGHLEVTIEDDGIGITAEQTAASSSFGLIGMRERVEGLRGELTVQGVKGKGTTVHVTVPLSPEGGPV